jgi:hypothetical protein
MTKIFCNQCVEGICLPKTSQIRGLDGEYANVKHSGCVAAFLYRNGHIRNPEKQCGCYADNPDAHLIKKEDGKL